MADLFLARTVTDTFERLVVIKKILPRFADHPRFVQLFGDEARLAKSLKHKNIVEVFDVGGTGGETFFAMEYLHGQDVRSLLHRAWKRDEKMPIKHAVHIATQVASALSYAHAMRRSDGTLLDIVHRDVSPSNIIVSYDGAVKLLDFGVAKAATSSVKTRTGTLKGKIAYMSPEQAKGGSVDKRSDVFSLGICLWEMLTTSRLFRGENDLATLQLIINEAPKKPSDVNPEVPKELERIVLRALAQDPKQRYQTAHELQTELEELVRLQQMVQSTSALGMYMSVLFQPEIAAWKDAKAAGTALSEHLTQVHENKNELTTPISESEFIEPLPDDDEIDEDEDIEDDLEQAAASGTIETKEAWPRKPPSAVPVLAMQDTSSQPVPIGKAGSTPVVRPSTSALGPVIAPTLPPRKDPTRPPPTPIAGVMAAVASPSVAPSSRATPSTPMPVVRTITPVGVPIVSPPAAIPIATPADGLQRPSWPGIANVSLPSHEALPFSEEQAQQLRRRFFRVGGAVLGLLFSIAIIKACAGSGGDDTTKPDEPPPTTAAPALTPPSAPDARIAEPAIPDAGVASVVAPAAVTPDAGAIANVDSGSAAPVTSDDAGSHSAKPPKKDRKRRTQPPPQVTPPPVPPPRPTGTYDSPIAPPRPKR